MQVVLHVLSLVCLWTVVSCQSSSATDEEFVVIFRPPQSEEEIEPLLSRVDQLVDKFGRPGDLREATLVDCERGSTGRYPRECGGRLRTGRFMAIVVRLPPDSAALLAIREHPDVEYLEKRVGVSAKEGGGGGGGGGSPGVQLLSPEDEGEAKIEIPDGSVAVNLAPLYRPSNPQERVSGQFIVVFKTIVNEQELLRQIDSLVMLFDKKDSSLEGVRLMHCGKDSAGNYLATCRGRINMSTFKALLVSVDDDQSLQSLRENPYIAYIEQNAVVSIDSAVGGGLGASVSLQGEGGSPDQPDQPRPQLAPLYRTEDRTQLVSGEYIVVFTPDGEGVEERINALVQSLGKIGTGLERAKMKLCEKEEATGEYPRRCPGIINLGDFKAILVEIANDDQETIDVFRRHGDVAYVEQSSFVTLDGGSSSGGVNTGAISVPEIPKYVPSPSESLCNSQRSKIIGSQLQDAFIPECLPDGRYKAKQCYILFTPSCWCVNQITGQEVPNTRAEGFPALQRLDCPDPDSNTKTVPVVPATPDRCSLVRCATPICAQGQLVVPQGSCCPVCQASVPSQGGQVNVPSGPGQCVCSQWSDWSPCNSANCDGQQESKRTCQSTGQPSASCQPVETRTRPCSTSACFSRFEKTILNTFDVIAGSGLTADQCQKACIKETRFSCMTVNLETGGDRRCTLSRYNRYTVPWNMFYSPYEGWEYYERNIVVQK